MKQKQLLTFLLLLVAGVSNVLFAQTAVTVGSQVTAESQLVSGRAYVVQQRTGNEAYTYLTDNGQYLYSNNATANLASVFYFLKNSDNTWELLNAYTGRYWGIPSKTDNNSNSYVNSRLTTVATETAAGNWNLNFDNNLARPTAYASDGTTLKGIDRAINYLLGWGDGTKTGNTTYIRIYEVSSPALSTSVLNTLVGYDVSVSATAASSLSEGQWYVVKNQNATTEDGGRGYIYENQSTCTFYNTATAPSGSASANAKYLVRLLNVGDGKYYLQTGYGNYMGAIEDGENNNSATVPVTSLGSAKLIISKINSTDGHFYLQNADNNAVLNAVSLSNGDAKLVGWGITAPTSTNGNNDWAFFPVEFVESWVPTSSEVYTINNTNTSRGALIYNPDASTKHVWSSGKSGTFDASNANSQWVIYPTGSERQYYLYNVGAGKFAIPSGNASGAGNPWVFSNNAVAVTFITQSDGTRKIKMAKNPASGNNEAYLAVSNGQTNPIINYNDVGGNFTITKVDGNQSTAVTAAVNKLLINQSALTAAPTGEGWYAIRVKTHATYADQYVFTRESEATHSSTSYPLGFYSNVNVQPSISDAAYLVKLTKSTYGHYCQMPNGLYIQGASKPVSGAGESSIAISYDATNHFTIKSGSYFWQPYYLSSNYFIGETGTTGTTYYDIYPVNLTTAGLTSWKLTVEGLSADTKVTCTRSDVSGLNAVYTNGYFFLPTGQTPAQGDFTATVSGATITLPVSIDSENHTITASVPVLTINSPNAEATFTWNGESKTGKTVTFTYTGGTITDNAITVTYSGDMFQSPTLSQSTWDGTASTTVTCTMTPAFFSSTYGEKWVRIVSAKAPTLVVDLADVTEGASTTMAAHDYFDATQLWCLVGNSSSFTLYNKAAGSNYVLTSGAASPVQNTTIALQPAASATNATWALGDGQLAASDAPGYALYASGSDGNNSMHGWQSGNTVKYWGAASGGSHFLIEDASGEVSLVLSGLDPRTMTVYTQNIASLPITIGGTTSNSLLTKDKFSDMTAYLPKSTELTLGAPAMFMNYGFKGYDGTDQTKTVTATSTPQTVSATFSVVHPDARYLWEPLRIYNGEGEKDYYRIPAIVTAKNGDILAINDRRWNNDTDLGNNSGTAANPVNHHIDIIGVSSSDNGNTWSNEFMIMDGTGSGALAGYGDAAVVADRENNKVLVMACAGNVFYTGQNNSYHQTIQRTVLTHNGTSWVAETPTDVTSQFYAGSLTSSDGMFIGSGALSQSKIIKKGDYYRIYCTVLERSSSNFVFYSDDFGLTWTMMGSSAPAHDNEPKVDELPDGSVLLSVRKSNGRTFNVWTWEDDNYTSGSWGTAVASNDQTGGISFGNNSTNGDIRMIPAIKKSTGEVVTLAMQSVPTANSRAEVSLYYKELDPSVTYTPTTIAQNWSSRFLITPHSSAYSSFNPQPDGRIAFYMEEAPKSATGFYMCYVPLTLDEITDNQYTGIASTFDVTLNTVGDASYATLYLPFDVTTDANTKAYVIKAVGTGYATLTELENGEIAAKTAVVLVNETSNAAAFTIASETLTQQVAESENYLKGTLVSKELDLSDATSNYSLGKKEINGVAKIGFYKFNNNGTTTITLGANKAYLEAPASGGAVKGFVLDFGGEDGIGQIVNGKSVNGKWYNLAGQRVGNPTRGVYIVGGKKVVVK